MIFVMDNKYYEKLIEPEDGEEYDIKAFDEINRLNNQIIFRNEIRRIV